MLGGADGIKLIDLHKIKGLLSDEEALQELMQGSNSSKKDKSNETASTSTTSGGGAATDQGRLKLVRLLRLADKLVADKEGTVGQLIDKDATGSFVWAQEEQEQEEETNDVVVPMDVEPSRDENMLVYKTGADGGPALLVPGMFLQQDAPEETVAVTKKLSMSPDNQDQSVASERLPVFDATPVNLQTTGTPLAVPHPTEPGMGAPSGATAFGALSGVRLPRGLQAGGGSSGSGGGGSGLLPPPPGFASPAPPPPSTVEHQPETLAESMRMYGHQLQMETANPFANPPPGLSNAFTFSAPAPAVNPSSFLGSDPMSAEGTSLLDSGLLNSLWMDDPNAKTKNPFAT